MLTSEVLTEGAAWDAVRWLVSLVNRPVLEPETQPPTSGPFALNLHSASFCSLCSRPSRTREQRWPNKGHPRRTLGFPRREA